MWIILASFILECSGGLIAGFYAPCSQSHLTVLAESLPSVPGILYNTNTVESFHALDKSDLLKKEAAKVDRDYSIPLFI